MAGLGEWYIRRGHDVEGPLLEVEMVQRARDGRLDLNDQVGEDPTGPWVEARTIEKFFPGGLPMFDRPSVDEVSAMVDAAANGNFVPAQENPAFEREKKKQRIFQRWELIVVVILIVGYYAFRWMHGLVR